MEKQMRAEREKRATILTAEGFKQSQILTAEGERQSQILRAEGERQSAILRAEGEAKAIATVFEAIHTGDPDPKLLAYTYLQSLPQIANGQASKIWVLPAELSRSIGALGEAFAGQMNPWTAPPPSAEAPSPGPQPPQPQQSAEGQPTGS
jgi:regulator of protease activity HflC (stomatin/prohibitin superfamily)